MMNIAVIDFETCGVAEDERVPVEVACIVVDSDLNEVARFSELCNPERRITWGAMATHNITQEMVLPRRSHREIMNDAVSFMRQNGARAMCAFNAPFEQSVIKPYNERLVTNVPWICAMRTAKHLVPGLDSYKLQALKYALSLKSSGDAHRAINDVELTIELLRALRNDEPAWVTPNDPASWAKRADAPLLLDIVHFGKHRGDKWSIVPKDYLEWLIRSGHDDQDVVNTAKHWLSVDFEPDPAFEQVLQAFK